MAVPVAIVVTAAALVGLTVQPDGAAAQPNHSTSSPVSTAPADDHAGMHGAHDLTPADRATAMLAAAAYQDVDAAEAVGYASSIKTLGCFQDPERGGMGVHYINSALLDGRVAIDEPEALVYELDGAGRISGLVAHEYIVPVEAWPAARPPRLFGLDFHRHSTLPLWVLHTWLWKDNPLGVFADWNPAVRLCPSGVPIFGEDLP